MRETVVEAAGPLGAPFFALDLGGIDQPPFLGPLGSAGMGLVVSDVLRGGGLKTRSNSGLERTDLDIKVVAVACG